MIASIIGIKFFLLLGLYLFGVVTGSVFTYLEMTRYKVLYENKETEK